MKNRNDEKGTDDRNNDECDVSHRRRIINSNVLGWTGKGELGFVWSWLLISTNARSTSRDEGGWKNDTSCIWCSCEASVLINHNYCSSFLPVQIIFEISLSLSLLTMIDPSIPAAVLIIRVEERRKEVTQPPGIILRVLRTVRREAIVPPTKCFFARRAQLPPWERRLRATVRKVSGIVPTVCREWG